MIIAYGLLLHHDKRLDTSVATLLYMYIVYSRRTTWTSADYLFSQTFWFTAGVTFVKFYYAPTLKFAKEDMGKGLCLISCIYYNQYRVWYDFHWLL